TVADILTHQPQAHVLLLGILPRGEGPTDFFRGEIAQTNQLISQLANGTSVTYADLGGLFLQPGGSISPALMFDFIHPTKLGYDLLTTELQGRLQALLPGSPVEAGENLRMPTVQESPVQAVDFSTPRETKKSEEAPTAPP